MLLPIVGGLVGLFFGVVIGYLSTRRAGTTFAMISLGFGEMVTAMTLIFIAFFNGEEGVQTDRMVGPEVFGVTFGPDREVYYLIAVWCFIAMVAMYMLTRTPFGRMSNAVRDNPERAEFVGYNTQRVRWLAFSLSAFFAGVAGSLHAINFEHVGFETVGALREAVEPGRNPGIRRRQWPLRGALRLTRRKHEQRGEPGRRPLHSVPSSCCSPSSFWSKSGCSTWRCSKLTASL